MAETTAHTTQLAPGATLLVTNGTGRTGRTVAEAATAAGLHARPAARSTEPRFDWQDQDTWEAALHGAAGAYLAYPSDIGAPDAAATIGAFARRAVAAGVRRLVLLSARGEDLALPAERALRESGADWTVVRASWFQQNFSEGPLLDGLRGGELVLPVGETKEPFIDVRDIADVVVAAIRDPAYSGQIIEVSGPRLLSFREAAAEITAATGQDIRYVELSPQEYTHALTGLGIERPEAEFVTELFATLLDGRNARLSDGVRRILGREPRDFTGFAREEAAAGTWKS
ncbi:NmrA family NAD(P)-binding protein [Streptomyces monticola]|uniref:NmrA family NAD(P)-binding protein n=1 Tax=Streptomyces monticola TaxID=2666263 RepID=A0ABW2JAA5_9ACTN